VGKNAINAAQPLSHTMATHLSPTIRHGCCVMSLPTETRQTTLCATKQMSGDGGLGYMGPRKHQLSELDPCCSSSTPEQPLGPVNIYVSKMRSSRTTAWYAGSEA
jgi:hypothetical protein